MPSRSKKSSACTIPDAPSSVVAEPPAAYYTRAKEPMFFFGQPVTRGTFLNGVRANVTPAHDSAPDPHLFYKHPNGELWTGDSIRWLKTLPSEHADLVFADPPYNIKKAEWDTFESQESYIQWSLEWIAEAARVLKPSGTLYICGFSEVLADLRHPASKYFAGCRWIIWHYMNKANLGNDWGRSHESILHFRKTRDFTFNTDSVRFLATLNGWRGSQGWRRGSRAWR